jgi:hypothetical protein
LFVGGFADRLDQFFLADRRSRFLREFDGFVAHSSFSFLVWLDAESIRWIQSSEHLFSDTGEVLRVVEMLVIETLQSVSNDFGTVVAQAITQAIKLVHKFLGGSNSEILIAVAVCGHFFPL